LLASLSGGHGNSGRGDDEHHWFRLWLNCSGGDGGGVFFVYIIILCYYGCCLWCVWKAENFRV
jgi:hypothetical protein